MGFSRRKFLRHVAGAAAAGVARRCAGWPALADRPAECGLLDLGREGGLGESAAGYRLALATLGVRYMEVSPGAIINPRLWVVSAAIRIDARTAQSLAAALHAGSRLLLESAAGFAEPSTFREHQAVLQDHFGIAIEAPAQLWPRSRLGAPLPYVDYSWPLRMKIRDFSRVAPLARAEEGTFGWVGGMPIAVRRRLGRGTLIFLGSPLGPALWCGDREAHAWLRGLVLDR